MHVYTSPETPTCEVPSNGVVEISLLPYCALENEADLYVNERQKIRHYRCRSTEERRIRRRIIESIVIESIVIESVDSISRDEPDSPLTQYITNAGISRARYTIKHFKHHNRVLP